MIDEHCGHGFLLFLLMAGLRGFDTVVAWDSTRALRTVRACRTRGVVRGSYANLAGCADLAAGNSVPFI
jgi:hypothetical protein